MNFYVVEPCATARGIEIKLRDRKLDLAKAERALSAIGEIMGSSPVVLLVKVGKYSISVYGSGRMMVKGARKSETKKVGGLAEKLVTALEKGGALV
ncbi:MAG: hypothetical protein AB1324_03685 [Candidatus Micrarchaeota archaeon]